MNILFLTLSKFSTIQDQHIYLDLLRKFIEADNLIFIVSRVDSFFKNEQKVIEESGVKIVRVKTGRIQKTNIIEKGINTVCVSPRYKNAIKKYFKDIKFDLVLYPTPPITFIDVVSYIKKRDGAKSYLMLKDIFPQNAVDIGILSKKGLKGLLYHYFRRKEKELYAISDCIGCMSPANVEYLLTHNPEISSEKVGLCPNSIEVRDLSLNAEEKVDMREKYGLPTDKIIFVYGGNFGLPQGIPFIIECLRSQMDNPDVYFLIVGSGTEYGQIEEFFRQSKPTNIKLMKSIPRDEYDRMIAACDVGMIFLDHRFTIPNFPSRLLSYMQAKLAVLACTDPITDIGKIIVDGGFGWWCESLNVKTFKNMVEKIKTADLESLGQNGFEYLNREYSVSSSYRTILDSLTR